MTVCGQSVGKVTGVHSSLWQLTFGSRPVTCSTILGGDRMAANERNGACWRLLKKRVPIVGWLPSYNGETALADLIAGLTVGLTVMPQGLAYAALAGLDTQYGLYSAFMGCFVYTVLGGCKDITIGPTALMSLMTYQQVFQRNSDYAVLLCFLTGCVQLLMAPLRLEFAQTVTYFSFVSKQ